ncbi:MAG TPA: alpha/beta hydrolase [Vicinamibacterales bacterium]|jgi:pimeloyl-ACP methyl ester carboxylesterase|nr:alpha/beta hydrolase [Vicinamibacterales bacterium]
MPIVRNGGADIYWEARGSGPPVLLISGLGSSLDLWARLDGALDGTFKRILFDNQGIGRSSDEPRPYTIEGMADVAAGVIDAAGEQSVHVIGNSMGGMIAQELVLRHPTRVKSLVLGCTTCGGRQGAAATREVLAMLSPNPALTREESFRATAGILYSPATPPERIDEDIAIRMRVRRTAEGYQGQLLAIRTWSGTFDRLSQIRVPTLVLHGTGDRLIPAENGRILAGAIPNAKLVLLEGAEHMMFADRFEPASRAVLEFLEKEI